MYSLAAPVVTSATVVASGNNDRQIRLSSSSNVSSTSTLQMLQFRQLSRSIVSTKNWQIRAAGETKRKFTGFVEKDTAGQQNIYSVEPTVYIAETAFSTSSGGSSSEGSGGTLTIVGLLALAAVAGAAAILFTVGSSQPVVSDLDIYSGPPLDYYIQKFQSPELVQPEVEVVVDVVSAPDVEQAVTPDAVEESLPDAVSNSAEEIVQSEASV